MENHARRFFRLTKEPLLTSFVKANAENRFWAKGLDFILVEGALFFFRFFFTRSALILPWVIWPLLDRMGRGQSPGKWLLGLHTIEGNFGKKPNFFQSLVRNLPCILVSMSLGFGGFGQWVVSVPAMLWCVLEVYFMFNLRSGVRMGDIFANTRVFDYKDEHTQFIEQFLKEPDVL